MAAEQLIPVGSTEALSSEIEVSEDQPVAIAVNSADGSAVMPGGRMVIEVKDPAGNFYGIASVDTGLTDSRGSGTFIAGGVYRVRRLASPIEYGVFRTG